MRGIIIALALAGAVTLAMCARGDRPVGLSGSFRIDEVVAAIDSGNARWMRGALTADVDTMLAVYDADPRSLSSSGSVTIGRDTLRVGMERFYGNYEVLDVFVETHHVWLEDNNAWEKGIYGMTLVTPEGDTASFQEQYLARWQHQPDGSWKTHMTMTFPFAEPKDWQ